MNLIKAELHFKPKPEMSGMRGISSKIPKTIYLNEYQIVSINQNMEVTLNSPLKSIYGELAYKIVLSTKIELPKK